MDIIPAMRESAAVPLISVVVPNYNGARLLEACLQSLLRQSHGAMEIIVADNGSSDDSLQIVSRVAPAAVWRDMRGNKGFAAAVNEGIRTARGSWIAVLNNDTEAESDWLTECMAAAERHPEASFLACRILDFSSRDRVYGAGDCFLRAGIGYRRGQEQPDQPRYHIEEEVFSACGCAALYRKIALEEREGFDERFFAYLEDIELGLRLQNAEHRGWFVPGAVVYHHGGATSGGEFSPLSVRLRTRNAILLVLKSLPGRIIARCALRIAFAQLFWFARVIAHGRLWSYLRGIAGALRLTPAMLAARKAMRHAGRRPAERLWAAILRSESMARGDVAQPKGTRSSMFLDWYFRLFPED
jgi:GT2 family glycosyltransferase